MKKTIFFCSYKEWTFQIYDYLKEKYKDKADFHLIKTRGELREGIKKSAPDMIFFIWWIWIVEKEIVNKVTCINLHPTPLPKYRGGSAIPNQIINGETKSAVTLFIMNEHIDKGPILWQEEFSLEGDLHEVFSRIIEKAKIGFSAVTDSYLENGRPIGTPQDESKATYCKQRTPDQSEIKISDFENFTALQLHNKIRALQDPYPNAFVVCKNGTRLYFQKSEHG